VQNPFIILFGVRLPLLAMGLGLADNAQAAAYVYPQNSALNGFLYL
jgi:hypothetical protein